MKKVYHKVLGTDNLTTEVEGRTKVNVNTIGANGNPKIDVNKQMIISTRSPPRSPTPLISKVLVKGKNDNTKI